MLTPQELQEAALMRSRIIRNFWVIPNLVLLAFVTIAEVVSANRRTYFSLLFGVVFFLQAAAIVCSFFTRQCLCIQICLWLNQPLYYGSLVHETGISHNQTAD